MVLASAALVRLLALRGDLWIDEIWSVQAALAVDGPLGVFTSIRTDNNHWLNTVYLQFIGPTERLYYYRIMAFTAGVGTTLLASLLALKRGRVPALLAASIFGFSYILIHFSSEARGYSLAIFLGLVAYALLERFLATREAGLGLAFGVTSSLGFLAQLTFAWVHVGFAAWSFAALRRDRGRGGWVLPLVRLHALPSAVVALLFLVDVRSWAFGGGPPRSVGSAGAELMRFTLGFRAGGLEVVFLLAISLFVALEIARLVRGRDPKGLFFVGTLASGPLVLGAAGLDFMSPRYFLVSVPFFLLICLGALERWALRGRAGRVLVAALLAAFLLGNATYTYHFLRDLRGQYRPALIHMAGATVGAEARVSFRAVSAQEPVVDFYRPFLPEGRTVRVVPLGEWGGEPPEWLIVQDFRPGRVVPEGTVEEGGRTFDFDARFPYSGASGWAWNVYRLRPGDGPP